GLIDEKTLDKLNKVPINDSIYIVNFKNICNKALEDALVINKIDHYNHYIQFYKKASLENKKRVIKKRNIVAYNTAIITHTIESYTYFIKTYPQANQIDGAWSQIYNIAFEYSKEKHTISGYNYFVNTYPNAPQVHLATQRIHTIAFNNAKTEHTSISYKDFFENYPNSEQYNEAFNLYESTQFLENTKNKDWLSYQNFIINFQKNSKIEQAKDSIITLGIRYSNISALESYINNYYEKREYAIEKLYPLFTSDGEQNTINLFVSRYGQPNSLHDQIEEDLQNSFFSEGLLLNLPFDRNNKHEYERFIKNSAPHEIAFVALQRMISHDIKRKRWRNAII
ncbi:MAG: hypothetical protein ACKVJA_04280, partial [Flavobacteriales bacterium]